MNQKTCLDSVMTIKYKNPLKRSRIFLIQFLSATSANWKCYIPGCVIPLPNHKECPFLQWYSLASTHPLVTGWCHQKYQMASNTSGEGSCVAKRVCQQLFRRMTKASFTPCGMQRIVCTRKKAIFVLDYP